MVGHRPAHTDRWNYNQYKTTDDRSWPERRAQTGRHPAVARGLWQSRFDNNHVLCSRRISTSISTHRRRRSISYPRYRDAGSEVPRLGSEARRRAVYDQLVRLGGRIDAASHSSLRRVEQTSCGRSTTRISSRCKNRRQRRHLPVPVPTRLSDCFTRQSMRKWAIHCPNGFWFAYAILPNVFR